jgi:hypothetical protein
VKGIVWWLCISYCILDASTEGYEEEEVFYEEEEEHFDYCTNQGKLLLMQAILLQATLMQALLEQGTIAMLFSV